MIGLLVAVRCVGRARVAFTSTSRSRTRRIPRRKRPNTLPKCLRRLSACSAICMRKVISTSRTCGRARMDMVAKRRSTVIITLARERGGAGSHVSGQAPTLTSQPTAIFRYLFATDQAGDGIPIPFLEGGLERDFCGFVTYTLGGDDGGGQHSASIEFGAPALDFEEQAGAHGFHGIEVAGTRGAGVRIRG